MDRVIDLVRDYNMNRVYWITGLSGAGKTTIGKKLYERLKEKNCNIVFLDGDILREVFGGDLGYSREERVKCAMRYARLCKMLVEQGLDVICCTISMFDSVREWNRKNIKGYIEIYIKVPIEVLQARDQKGMYSSKIDNLIGITLEYEEPKAPDLVIENNNIEINESVLKIMECTGKEEK